MTHLSTLPWLLEAATPLIRYFALTRLADLPRDDPQVVEAQQKITMTGPVPVLFMKQSEQGGWAGEQSYYTPKYTSTHWSMMLLAELGVDGSDPRMRRGSEFMLNKTEGDIARKHAERKSDIECLWGNILRYTLQAGFEDHRLVKAMVDYLVFTALEGGWRCPHNGGQPCAWGAARALWGFSAVTNRSDFPGLADAIASGIHFLLEEHSLLQANYPSSHQMVSPIWFKLNFPLFYQVDILFVLRVMTELGTIKHPQVEPALDWLSGKRQKNGRFLGISPFRSRTYSALGSVEETRRWVTLQAEWVLKSAA